VQVNKDNLQILSPHLPERAQERRAKSVKMLAESEKSTALKRAFDSLRERLARR